MEKYGQRVVAARNFIGWSQTKMARELGITQPSLSELESGNATSSKHTLKISQKTGVRAEWLDSGKGEMTGDAPQRPVASEDPAPFRPEQTAALNIHQMPQNIPVLGGALCDSDNEGDGLFEFNGQTLDFVRRPPRLMGVKDAYALYCLNDCMAPWREHGQLVYVHPGQPVKIGDYVVVQMKQDGDGKPIKAFIKRLVRRTATSVVLQQYNPAREISLPTKKIGKIERIIDWSELMGL